MQKLLTKYLGLDIKYFFINGLYGSIQQIIGMLCGFGVNYVYGHFIDKQIYGEFNLVLSIVSMITFVSFPGIDSALLSSIGKGDDQTYPYAVKKKMTFSVIGSLLLILFAVYYFINNQYSVFQGLVLSACCYPFLYAFQLSTQFLTGKRRFKVLAFLSSISSIIFLLSTTTFVFLYPTTFGLVTSYVIGIVFPAFLSFLYSRKYINKNTQLDHTVISYGSFLTVVSILPWFGSYIGNILLGTLAGAAQLAVFSVAYDLFSIINKNFVVFFKPATAKLAQITNSYVKTIHTHFFKLFALGIFLGIGMYAIAPIFITFLFPLYPEAVGFARLLSISLIPVPLIYALNDSLIFKRKKTPHIMISTVPHIIKIGLFIILIPLYKIQGLILVAILDRFIYAVCAYGALVYSERNRQ